MSGLTRATRAHLEMFRAFFAVHGWCAPAEGTSQQPVSTSRASAPSPSPLPVGTMPWIPGEFVGDFESCIYELRRRLREKP